MSARVHCHPNHAAGPVLEPPRKGRLPATVVKVCKAWLQRYAASLQDRHYNAHDYLAEKRQALELFALLDGRKPDSRETPSKVG